MSSAPMHRIQIGPIRCSSHTIRQTLDEVRRLLRDRALRPRGILDLNAHIFNLAWTNKALRRSLDAARIVTADGMGVVWACRLFGHEVPERCNSTEAFRAFVLEHDMPANKGVLVGATQPEVEAAAAEIGKVSSHCRIIKAVSGYMEDEDYRKMFIEAADADFIFLGLSTPNTQRVADIAFAVRPDAITWGIGAGTIKIFAGTMSEAPVFWRRTGLQWLYRLFEDPKNLWRRYLLGNPLFVARVLKAWWGKGISP